MSVLWMVDGVLAVLVVESVVLAIVPRRRLRLPAFRVLLPNLAAGFFLVLAVRCALRGQDVLPIAACLAASGFAHALDLRLRRR